MAAPASFGVGGGGEVKTFFREDNISFDHCTLYTKMTIFLVSLKGGGKLGNFWGWGTQCATTGGT